MINYLSFKIQTPKPRDFQSVVRTWASSSSSPWELVRSADSQAQPKGTESETLGVELNNLL